MSTLQEQYDDAMFDFSTGNCEAAITKMKAILEIDPCEFDTQLSLGMAYYRKGDYDTAILEGHKAEKLKPNEQLVHTNLSLFYMKKGDKKTAEDHGLKARIAFWKSPNPVGGDTSGDDPDLAIAKSKPESFKLPEKFPDMPWKKKAKIGSEAPPAGSPGSAQEP